MYSGHVGNGMKQWFNRLALTIATSSIVIAFLALLRLGPSTGRPRRGELSNPTIDESSSGVLIWPAYE